MAQFFSSDPLNISLCEKTGIGSKSIVKLKFLCTSYASNLCCEMLYLSKKLVEQYKNELPGTSMASTMIVSKFEKSHGQRKSSVSLP